MKRASVWIGAVVLAFASVCCFSLAAASPDGGLDAGALAGSGAAAAPASSTWSLAKDVYHAVQGGNYRLGAALALLLLVAGLRWLAPRLHDKLGDFLNSDYGATLLVWLAGVGSALATAFAAGQALTGHLLLTAAEISLTAAGGYSMLKKLFWPLAQKLWGKLFGTGAPPAQPPAQ